MDNAAPIHFNTSTIATAQKLLRQYETWIESYSIKNLTHAGNILQQVKKYYQRSYSLRAAPIYKCLKVAPRPRIHGSFSTCDVGAIWSLSDFFAADTKDLPIDFKESIRKRTNSSQSTIALLSRNPVKKSEFLFNDFPNSEILNLDGTIRRNLIRAHNKVSALFKSANRRIRNGDPAILFRKRIGSRLRRLVDTFSEGAIKAAQKRELNKRPPKTSRHPVRFGRCGHCIVGENEFSRRPSLAFQGGLTLLLAS